MPTLRDYFLVESKEILRLLMEQVNRFDASDGNAAELSRVVRALRGSAQLARETRVFQASLALEAAARAVVAGSLSWNPDVSGRARRSIEDIEALVKGGADADSDEARVRRVLERWRELGVAIPDAALEGPATSSERSAASQQFRDFAAHEVSGITSEIEAGLAQLAQDPRNRDALKAILRRQRALLGSARLDEVGVVAETLRAMEDLVRVIARLNVAVKDEWIAVFRAARDVLAGALEPLKSGKDPVASPALSKLRTLRSELLERYGDSPAVPAVDPAAATAAAAPVVAAAVQPGVRPDVPTAPVATSPQAASVSQPTIVSSAESTAAQVTAPVADAGPDTVVPIELLCYDGDRALRRALELHGKITALAGDDPDAVESVEELFDLVRLGIG